MGGGALGTECGGSRGGGGAVAVSRLLEPRRRHAVLPVVGAAAVAAVAESITREGTQCLLSIVRALSSAARPGHRVEFL